MKLKDMLSDKQLKTLKSMKALKESNAPGFKNRKFGDKLPTLDSIQKEYNDKKGNKLNEEYVELMELEEGLEKIAEEWGRWKSGPATERSDIAPARKEVLNFCVAWLKKYIK